MNRGGDEKENFITRGKEINHFNFFVDVVFLIENPFFDDLVELAMGFLYKCRILLCFVNFPFLPPERWSLIDVLSQPAETLTIALSFQNGAHEKL